MSLIDEISGKRIASDVLNNKNYRQIVFSHEYMQITENSLCPGGAIDWETHMENDQFMQVMSGAIIVEQGTKFTTLESLMDIETTRHPVGIGKGWVVPSGTDHKVSNASDTMEAKFLTIYGGKPPHKVGGHYERVKEKLPEESTSRPSLELM